ncbi:hypothetical protein E2C01_009935 [Portunus trituberculatus]|uniref:Uncharacterized protein n=1 Tax=Portunus trituberculatus TaxID=210409 RepID=A0A5B7D733_PORTR|nr:hypothetical protein [Portunus trituberculatus]
MAAVLLVIARKNAVPLRVLGKRACLALVSQHICIAARFPPHIQTLPHTTTHETMPAPSVVGVVIRRLAT